MNITTNKFRSILLLSIISVMDVSVTNLLYPPNMPIIRSMGGYYNFTIDVQLLTYDEIIALSTDSNFKIDYVYMPVCVFEN